MKAGRDKPKPPNYKTEKQNSHQKEYFVGCESWIELIIGLTQCPRTDLNKMFLPKPMTTTG